MGLPQQSPQQDFVYPPAEPLLTIESHNRDEQSIAFDKGRICIDVHYSRREAMLLQHFASFLAQVTSGPSIKNDFRHVERRYDENTGSNGYRASARSRSYARIFVA
jgi:hypothetical protein